MELLELLLVLPPFSESPDRHTNVGGRSQSEASPTPKKRSMAAAGIVSDIDGLVPNNLGMASMSK